MGATTLVPFFVENYNHPLWFENLSNIFDEDLKIARPTGSEPLLIFVQFYEDLFIHRLNYLLTGATTKTADFWGHQFVYKTALFRLGRGLYELVNHTYTTTGEDEDRNPKLRRRNWPKIYQIDVFLLENTATGTFIYNETKTSIDFLGTDIS